MKKYLLFIFFTLSAWSSVENSYPTREVVESGIKIIDIRTESEWIETGVLAGSHTITFFYNDGSYNVRKFLKELNRVLDSRDEEFALICRTGSRTRVVASFLGRNGYQVVNLVGGLLHATKKLGMRTVSYEGF